MSLSPNYAATPINGAVTISTANPNRDGTGTIGTLITGAADGTRVDAVQIKARGTTTAGMIRFFLHNGTSYFLLREEPIPAVTPSATAKTHEINLDQFNVVLQSGWSVRCSTEKAESFDITVTRGGSF